MTRIARDAHAAGFLIEAFGISDLEKLSRSGREFGVISAYRSNMSKSQNQKRHGMLMADLQKAGYRPTEFKSQWKDMATEVVHGEKSLYVPNVDFETLLDLSKKYDQDAILYKHESGSIGIYDKKKKATMAYDQKTGDMSVSKSTDRKKEYSRGRSVSFGLNLVEDHQFDYGNKPITKQHILDHIKATSKHESKDEDKPKDTKKDESKKERVHDFLDEMGDKKVSNPNPDSRDRYPKVMIRSLDWEHQKPFYEQWSQHT